MLYFLKTTLATTHTPNETLTQQLKRHPSFEVQEKKFGLLLARKRMLPSRGITRLLIPRIVTKIKAQETSIQAIFGLDAIATLMLFFVGGGVLVELTADRAEYPRDYPPEFIYGIALIYLVAVVYDLLKTRSLLKRIIAP